jgi:hypothetical protein
MTVSSGAKIGRESISIAENGCEKTISGAISETACWSFVGVSMSAGLVASIEVRTRTDSMVERPCSKRCVESFAANLNRQSR